MQISLLSASWWYFNGDKGQLAEIKKRCGTTCKEYRLLARAIVTGSENDW